MLYKGNKHVDSRGVLKFNNDFDATKIKRIYLIENSDISFIRGWQGHKIEQRWFACVAGKFKIGRMKIDNFEKPSVLLKPEYFELNSNALDFLHIPSGYITSIQSLENNSKLLVLADYHIGEIQDEYRFPLDYFIN